MRRTAWLALAAVSMLLAPGARADEQGSTVSAGTVPSVTCETRIQVIPRHGSSLTQRVRRHAVEIGGIYFVGARGYANEPRRLLDAAPGRTKPVKTPVLVPSGAAVTLTLGARSSTRSDIEIGLDQRPYRVAGDDVSLNRVRAMPRSRVDGSVRTPCSTRDSESLRRSAFD